MKKDTENLLLLGGGAVAVWYLFFRKATPTATSMLPKTTAMVQPSSGTGGSLLSSFTTTLSKLLTPAVQSAPVPASNAIQLSAPLSTNVIQPLPTDEYFNYDPTTGEAVVTTMSGVNDRYFEEFELM